MPELPEVEVIKRDLEREVVGKKIKSVEVTGARTVRRHRNRKEFIGLLDGRKISHVDRRGKYHGARAYRMAAYAPDNTAILFKRLMGTATQIKIACTGGL